MKNSFTASLLFLSIFLVSNAMDVNVNAFATCRGSKNCKACKNCKFCKHCKKNGGTCGVCTR